jgi:hypothetical protein
MKKKHGVAHNPHLIPLFLLKRLCEREMVLPSYGNLYNPEVYSGIVDGGFIHHKECKEHRENL